MKAVALAAAAISTGSAEVVVAGGMESMSNAPFYLKSAAVRKGVKLGSLGEIEDGMMVDGLTCALSSSSPPSCESGGAAAEGGREEEDEVEVERNEEKKKAERRQSFSLAVSFLFRLFVCATQTLIVTA